MKEDKEIKDMVDQIRENAKKVQTMLDTPAGDADAIMAKMELIETSAAKLKEIVRQKQIAKGVQESTSSMKGVLKLNELLKNKK